MSAIRVELELADGSFTSRMIHAGESVQRFEKNVGQSVVAINRTADASRTLLGTMRDLSIVMGAAGFAFHKIHQVTTGFLADIIKVNAEMERLTMLMKSMSTAADPMADAAKNVRYLRDMAKEAPFSLQGITDVFVKMKATGLDPMSGSMKSLIDGVAGVGGTEEGLKRAALAITQMSGKGVIQMEELRQQLGETMPRAVELMARSMGVSMSSFIKALSSGTVTAKPAIEAFLREVDRVYGGSSANMMQTFTGQSQLFLTNMQELALKVGEDGGFFGAVKNQLKDLNAFITSAAAADLSKSFGQGLTSFIGTLREGIDWIVRFRQEIMFAGEMLVYAFLAKLTIGGMTAFVGGIQAMSATLALLRVQLATVSTGMAANAAASIASGTAMALAREGFRNLGLMITFMGSAISMAAPWIPLIAIGVLAASSYFGIFSDKVRDAWQEMEKFGASSRKQAEEGAKFFKQQEDEVKRLKTARDQLDSVISPRERGGDGVRMTRLKEMDEQLAQKQKELEKLGVQNDTNLRQGAEKDAEKAAQKAVDALEAKSRDKNRIFDNAAREIDQRREVELRKELAANRETETTNKKFGAELRDLQIKYYTDRLDDLDAFTAKQVEILQSGNQAEIEAAYFALNKVNALRKQTQDNLDRQRAQSTGIVMTPKEIDQNELIKKGEKFLSGLKAEAIGLQAALQGANPEVAELKALLADMKFGDPRLEKVQALINKVLTAKKEVEELQELVNGKKKFDSALDAVEDDLNEREMALQTDGMSKIEALQKKLEMGRFKGLGPQATEAQRQFNQVKTTITEVDTAAKALAATFVESTFGNSVLLAAQALANVFGGIAASLGKVGDKLGAIDASKLTPAGSVTSAPATGQPVNVTGVDALVNAVAGAVTSKYPEARITSGRRNGDGNSQHDHGNAIDISLRALSPEQRKALIEEIARDIQAGTGAFAAVRGMGMYDPTGNLLHLDTRRTSAAGVENGVTAWGPNRSRTSLDQTPPWFGALMERLMAAGGTLPRPNPNNTTPAQNERITGLVERTAVVVQAEAAKELADQTKRYNMEAIKADESTEGLNKKLATVRAWIVSDKNKLENKDPDSDLYKPLIEAAMRADKADEERSRNTVARRKSEAAVLRQGQVKEDTAEKSQFASAGRDDPLGMKTSEAYMRFAAQQRKIFDDITAGLTPDAPAYRAALADMQNALDTFKGSEVTVEARAIAQRNLQTQSGLANETQARNEATQREIARLQGLIEADTSSYDERIRNARVFTEAIKLEQAKLAQSSPIAKMFKEWGSDSQNFQTQAVSMMNGFTSSIADMVVTGKADFKSMAQSWAKELINLALKSMLSKLMGGILGQAGGIFGSSLGGMSGGINTMGVGGLFHTGGVIGDKAPMTRSVDYSVFAGAPRFHTGGMIGRDEVPIIAQKGEGVFTAAQMKAMGIMTKTGGGRGGAGGPISISAPITVNGSSGTPDQNADLAKKMQQAMEGSMRTIVVDEIMKQRRPGNMLA